MKKLLIILSICVFYICCLTAQEASTSVIDTIRANLFFKMV